MVTDDLLGQILADPDDTSARMVYADALQAMGDPRGELIAVEIALAGPLPPPVRAAHLARRAELRALNGATWWPELPTHFVHTRRGFVCAIATPDPAACARLFATEPITRVELTAVVSFAPAPWQARITELALRAPLDRDAFRELIRSPLAAQLVELDLAGAMRGVVELEDALPHCRRLVLHHTPLAAQPWLFRPWHHFRQLEVLDARSAGFDGAGLEELLRNDLDALRVLELSGNWLFDAGPQLSRALPRLPSLARLSLVGTELTGVAHPALVDVAPSTFVMAGTTIELAPTAPDRHAVIVDGVRRRVRCSAIRIEDGRTTSVLAPQLGDDAALGPLADAIPVGIAYRLAPHGAVIELATAVKQLGGRMFEQRDTVEVRLGAEIDVTFATQIVQR